MRSGLRNGSNRAGLLILITSIGLLGGCSGEPASHENPVPAIPVAQKRQPLPGPTDLLTEADLERFLSVIAEFPGGELPEFSADDGRQVNEQLPAEQLVKSYREHFREVFDPYHQGRLWGRDDRLVTAFEKHGISAAEFAALASRISWAIASEALAGRLDLKTNIEGGERELEQLVQRIEEIDSQQTNPGKPASTERAQAVQKLQHTVALLEFADLLQSVPQQNRHLVFEYRQQLRPLLPGTDFSGVYQLFGEETDSGL